MMETTSYSGHDCAALENGALKLLVTRSIGPRILFLSLRRGENLLAELPDFVTECPGEGPFHFYGGHRLWHAPEDIRRTYLPDDAAVDVCERDGGLIVTQDVEARTGLQKSMQICLEGEEPRAVITHRLTNHGLWPVTCAPWAITQFKVGGVAILPQASEDTGMLPNRCVAMWPYTNPSDQHVSWGRTHVLVDVRVGGPFKIGFPNPRGWLAYWLNGTLFVKRAEYQAQSAYYDFGSSSEFYCSDLFVELETLAPIQSIAPGATISHVETWELYSNVERPRNERDAQALVTRLELG